jgi:hypothetical protein
MTWTRSPGRKAGMGNIWKGRWIITGYARYWAVYEMRPGGHAGVRVHPTSTDCYVGSMKEARKWCEENL